VNPIAFYRRQFHLLWRWSGGVVRLAGRAVATFAVAIIAFLAAAAIVPGIRISDVPAAALGALTLAALTTLARPVLIGLLSGFSVALAGIATIVLQAFGFWLLAHVPSGIQVDSLRSALAGSLVYAIADTLLAAGLSLADDRSFFGTLVRQLEARHGIARSGRTGVVFIQIDGLAEPILRKHVAAGDMPTLARWVRSGTHALDGWEPLLPTQTSASQAGILHGNNDGIPGFRWWDKETKRLLVSNHPADAREILRRVSNGRGLLANGGASIGNLLSGDATRSYLTAATIDDPAREARRSHVVDWFFISPYSYVRWLVLSVGEVVKEIVQAQRERASGVQPRGERGFPYPLARAASNVLLRHLTASLIVEEMYRAAPRIYADFVDYDEIAHHAGVDRVEARDALGGIDRIIGLLEMAAADAPLRYRFVVLSDHGQTPGETFRARFGQTLDEVVGDLAGEKASVHGATSHAEQSGRLGSLASESSRLGGIASRLSRLPFADAPDTDDVPDIVVAATGNLAHISLTSLPGRADRTQIDARYPDLVKRLAAHPGVGFVMVRTDAGPLAMGPDGTNDLDGHIAGADPLAPFGPRAAAELRRIDAMPSCGDLVVMSTYDAATGEVTSFEGQIGTHGGLGGTQTQAFVLHPTEWRIVEPIVGATGLHERLRAWVAEPTDTDDAMPGRAR
jgi:uncharacterized membrane protein YvlD (DUF360 family)